MQYNNLERVKTALAHKEPDRIPFDIGSSICTGINIKLLKRLRKYLGLPEKVEILEKTTQTGKVEDDLGEKLNIDIKMVAPEPPKIPGLSKDLGLQGKYYRMIEEFGIGYQMPKENGHFYDLYFHPLKNVEKIDDIKNYPWPNPLDPARFVNLKKEADKIVYRQKKAYFLERMSAGMWEHAMWMTGYEKFFTDMLLNEKLIHAIMDKFLEIKMNYWGKALDAVGDNVMIISEADDLGTMGSLLVSLDLYKKLIWPYHKKLFEFIKKKAKSKVYIWFHSDGAIREAIPLLIEAGIDILNPIQVNCRGMENTKKLKKEFGNDLTFWGGSCDNNILAFGTPDEVREETKKRINDLAPGGGYIFAAIHIIQSVVPVENVITWWETFKEFCKY